MTTPKILLKIDSFTRITAVEIPQKNIRIWTNPKSVNFWNGKTLTFNHDKDYKLYLRVWSWLRINAGGVLNTCKSNGVFLPRPRKLASKESFEILSGGRVSNAWATCLSEGDNVWKQTLIPHDIVFSHGETIKGAIRWKMGSRPIR